VDHCNEDQWDAFTREDALDVIVAVRFHNVQNNMFTGTFVSSLKDSFRHCRKELGLRIVHNNPPSGRETKKVANVHGYARNNPARLTGKGVPFHEFGANFSSINGPSRAANCQRQHLLKQEKRKVRQVDIQTQDLGKMSRIDEWYQPSCLHEVGNSRLKKAPNKGANLCISSSEVLGT